MFDSLPQKFIDSGILPPQYKEKVCELAEEYITENDVINHRKRKYLLSGAVLFVMHNYTDTVHRPATVAKKLGDDYSPSEITFSAYKLADMVGEEYQKPSTRHFAHYYAKKLDCRDKVHSFIDQLYEDVGELAGKSNSGTGAAVLYIASLIGNDKRTQSEIAEVSGRSEVGIRNLYYEILEQSTLNVDLA